MAMVVQTNTMAMNANRALSVNNSGVSKSLEKLSSGYRINRAADDASGLAISEKMKAQIVGLEQASTNSQDGISLIQTAEGATGEIHNILNRMAELATKSANGTIQDDVDREAIQAEIDSLNEEVTRISKSTTFNGINLLDGSLGGISATSTDGAAASSGVYTATGYGTYTAAVFSGTVSNSVSGTDGTDTSGTITVGSITATVVTGGATTGATAFHTEAEAVAYIQAELAKDTTFSYSGSTAFASGEIVTATQVSGFEAVGTAKVTSTVVTGSVATVTNSGAWTGATTQVSGTTTLNFDGKTVESVVGSVIEVDGVKFQLTDATFATDYPDLVDKDATAIMLTAGSDGAAIAATVAAALSGTATNGAVDTDATAATRTFTSSVGTGTDTTTVVTIESSSSEANDVKVTGGPNSGLILQVGDTSDDFNKVKVTVDDLSAEALGISTVDLSTQQGASDAIDVIKDAINTVSTNRANLGAVQNRLEYTINNLDTAVENMSAANSRIRDTDMATEMMEYTKMNILTSAAQSMLAQANQQPQSVLQLLQ